MVVALDVLEEVATPAVVSGVPKVTTPPPPPTPVQVSGIPAGGLAEAVDVSAAMVPTGRASARTPMRILRRMSCSLISSSNDDRRSRYACHHPASSSDLVIPVFRPPRCAGQGSSPVW